MARRILMIDDDREMVALGRLILEREGFEFLSAFGGAEGLELLEKQTETVDLILLDIMMVGLNGWHVLTTLKNSEKFAQIPVIMLTARHYLEDESETANYAGLFNGYVVKPFVVRDLLGQINGLLNKQDSGKPAG